MSSRRYQSLEQDEHGNDVDFELATHLQSGNSGENVEPFVAHYRQPTITWLLCFFLVNSLAFGITAVPRINLLTTLICHDKLDRQRGSSSDQKSPVNIGANNPQCVTPEISSAAATVASYSGILIGLTSAIASPILSSYGDKVGRIKILAVNTGGLLLAESVLVAVATLALNYKWLFLAFTIDGLTGSSVLMMAVLNAYVADFVPGDKRSIAMGRIQGAMFVGVAVGPLLSNLINAQENPLVVFYVCLIIRILSILSLLFMPESLPDSARGKPSKIFEYNLPTVSRFRPSVWLNHTIDEPGNNLARNVYLLLLIDVIVYGGILGSEHILVLYPQIRFGWGSSENNVFMSVTNIFRAVAATMVLPLLTRAFTQSSNVDEALPVARGASIVDIRLVRTAVFCDMAGYLGYSVAPRGIFYAISGALAAFGGVGLAVTEAALTKHVNSSHLGQLMGGVSFLQALTRILAPFVINSVYSLTVGVLAPTAFLSIATALMCALLLTCFLRTYTVRDPVALSV